MGKRSDFKRIPRDFYPTPGKAVTPLIPFLYNSEGILGTNYIEPCAGDASLTRHLSRVGLRCIDAYDIDPRHVSIRKADVLQEPVGDYTYITNPPWDRKILHPLIYHLTEKARSVWLLFDADWMHTKQAIPYLNFCSKIVSIGRIKWIPDSKTVGKDNCCWYNFQRQAVDTVFYSRT